MPAFHPSPITRSLADHVAVADSALRGGDRDALDDPAFLLRVSSDDGHPPGELACYPIDAGHPLDLLVGFVAPPRWSALGVSTCGWARRADDRGRVDRAGQANRVRVTVLLDRSGEAAGLLRVGGEVVELPGVPDGLVADACRRALRLPTPPPPGATVGLWARCWLDRIVDTAGGVARARRLAAGRQPDSTGHPSSDWGSWSDVVRLHPAWSAPSGPASSLQVEPAPESVAATTRALAHAWPWPRVQAEPAVLRLPGPLPPRDVTDWMDDGMWARWVLSSFPALDDLLDAVSGLLAPAVGHSVVQTVHAALGTDDPELGDASQATSAGVDGDPSDSESSSPAAASGWSAPPSHDQLDSCGQGTSWPSS